MNYGKQHRTIGAVVCLPPGWEVVQQPQPAAPEAVWCDTPPRPGEYHVEGLPCVCWVDEDVVWCPDWDRANERPLIRDLPRNGRRVSPVVKPPEPTP